MRPIHLILLSTALLSSCATSSPIKRFADSSSAFSEPPQLITHSYPAKDIYRIYHRGSTGFVSIQSLRQATEQRADDFARRQGKSFVVLGEKISQPPYILGNFPRIELVFALIDTKPEIPNTGVRTDKYADLEKLKKLFDEGALSKEEFETEKAKLLP